MTPEQRIVAMRAKQRAMLRVTRAANSHWAGLTTPAYIRKGNMLCKRCGSSLTVAGYAELRIVFCDDSAHITPVCKNCTTNCSAALLEAIYCADLLALADEEERVGVTQFWDMMADRQVRSYGVIT